MELVNKLIPLPETVHLNLILEPEKVVASVPGVNAGIVDPVHTVVSGMVFARIVGNTNNLKLVVVPSQKAPVLVATV